MSNNSETTQGKNICQCIIFVSFVLNIFSNLSLVDIFFASSLETSTS